jgi:hypothetical protein
VFHHPRGLPHSAPVREKRRATGDRGDFTYLHLARLHWSFTHHEGRRREPAVRFTLARRVGLRSGRRASSASSGSGHLRPSGQLGACRYGQSGSVLDPARRPRRGPAVRCFALTRQRVRRFALTKLRVGCRSGTTAASMSSGQGFGYPHDRSGARSALPSSRTSRPRRCKPGSGFSSGYHPHGL